VLAVDDDPRAVELVAKNLRGSGAEVVRAYGGREAIASARQILPDLVVLDLMMPNVNGFDVVEALKSRPETAGVPILIFTAKEINAADRQRLNGYVEKIVQKGDFNAKGFLREVKRALGKDD
jgi:CheY-like chemotaxis protein